MKSFTVTIEELVSQDFSVWAESRKEAVEKAIEMYRRGDFVLAPGELEMKRIRLDEDSDEWMEF